MLPPQNTGNNPNQGSAEAQPAQDIALSAGESSVQAMLSLVREYNSNAAFFNVVIPLLMLEAELALPLAGTNEQILSFLNSYLPNLDGRIDALYGRVGLAIPAHLQGSMITARRSTSVSKSEPSSQSQNHTISIGE